MEPRTQARVRTERDDRHRDLDEARPFLGGFGAVSAPVWSFSTELDRKGRTIVCTITCSPLDGSRDGLVLLMEESRIRDRT